jgi:hypothetical protein
VHEVLRCLEQTFVLNGYNLDGKTFILSFIFNLRIWQLLYLFLSHFGFSVFHERRFVIVFDKCTCGLETIQIFFAHNP